MIRELSNKLILDDFLNNVTFTDDEIKILKMYIKGEMLVKIASECGMSERNVSRVVKKIKSKYTDFKNIQIAKLKVFNTE